MTAITDEPTKGGLGDKTPREADFEQEPASARTTSSAQPAPAASPELERRHAKLRPAEPTVRAGAGRAPRANTTAKRPRPQTGPAREPAASPTLEIANAMVGAYKDALGRGPTKCRVHFAGADTLVVVLGDTMTVQERNLASLGEEEPLRESRFVLMRALEDRFRSIAERALGRRTLAFVSGFDTLRDVAVEVFTLAPEPTDGPTATR